MQVILAPHKAAQDHGRLCIFRYAMDYVQQLRARISHITGSQDDSKAIEAERYIVQPFAFLYLEYELE